MITALTGPTALRNSGAVASLMEVAFPSEFGEAWTELQLRGALLMPQTILYLADSDNELKGFALTRSVADECELLLIAVAPDTRGQSIGSELLHAVIEHCQSTGISKIFLEMRANNDALHFYQRHNFAIIGQRPNYYRGVDGQKFDALTFARPIIL